jgi:hypothetical protein
MKKILFTVMAVAAIGLSSCGNKAQQAEAVATDSVAVATAAADEAAEATVSELSSQLEAGDVNKFQQALETVKVKVAELIKQNPEIAKQYVAKVQDFLKENADKIKGLVGDNAAVAAAVSAITDADPANMVNGLLQSVGDAATNAKDAAVDAAAQAKDAAVDAANQKAEEAKQAAQDKANEAKDAAKQKASNAVDAAADKTKKALGL